MPIPLDTRDRRILIVAGTLLVLLAVAATAFSRPSADSPFGLPTTYSSGSSGARAAFLLLRDLDYDVERWERPLSDLPADPEGMLLILAEPLPQYMPTGGERAALRRFVVGGGRVLATGFFAGMFIPDAAESLAAPPPIQTPEEEKAARKKAEEAAKAAKQERRAPPRREVTPPMADAIDRLASWRTFSALLPSPITRDAPEIVMHSLIPWQGSKGNEVELYGAGSEIVVVRYAVGAGEVIWWAGPTPLINAAIREKNNLQFFLNCVGSPEDTTILWDEYAHGYGGSLGSYLNKTPVPWMALQVGLLFLVVVLTFSRRQTPLRPVRIESRLSPLEYVETLGDLYHRAGASGAAVEISYHRFRFLLTRRLGIAADTSAEHLARAARERLGWSEPGLPDVLLRAERARRSGDPSNAEALQLVQALHHYSELLRLRPRNPEEKP